MNTTKTLLLTLLLLPSTMAFAQLEERYEEVSKFKIQDFQLHFGGFSNNLARGGLSDFRMLAPESTILENDFTDYITDQGDMLSGGTSFGALLGINFRNKEGDGYRNSPTLRIGLSYYSGTVLSNDLRQETRKNYDKLTSAETGQTVYMDSMWRDIYMMEYNTEQLRLDASLLFRRKPEARWSVYAGIGFTIGMTIYAHTDLSYRRQERTEVRFLSGETAATDYSDVWNSGKEETYKNDNGIVFSTYIPLGVNFRLGEEKEFWKRTHLYYELRPSVTFTSVPELSSYNSGGIQQCLGLRFMWM